MEVDWVTGPKVTVLRRITLTKHDSSKGDDHTCGGSGRATGVRESELNYRE